MLLLLYFVVVVVVIIIVVVVVNFVPFRFPWCRSRKSVPEPGIHEYGFKPDADTRLPKHVSRMWVCLYTVWVWANNVWV